MQMVSMEWTCKQCGGTGKVRHPTSKIEESMLIVCSHCSTPSAYAWCEKCGMGGEVTGIDFSNFQRSWNCEECGSTYNLAKDFYNDQIFFTPIDFVHAKELELEREIREEKHIPVWVKNVVRLWENKFKYFWYVYAMTSVLVLLVIIVGSFLVLGCVEVYLTDDPRASMCSNIFFISEGLTGLLILILILNPIVQMFFGVMFIGFAFIYKVMFKIRKSREGEEFIIAGPQVYRLPKSRFIYSVAILIAIAGMSFWGATPQFLIGRLIFLTVVAANLFIPFRYRLVVSDKVISSIDGLTEQTLMWDEVAEIIPERDGVFLLPDQQSDIGIYINSQIESYSEVIGCARQKRPDLLKFEDITEFHQSNIESLFLLVVGACLMFRLGGTFLRNALVNGNITQLLLLLALSALIIWKSISKIHSLSLLDDTLIIRYFFWHQAFKVNEIELVELEQQMEEEPPSDFVHIRLKNETEIVLDKVLEGNSVLVSVIKNRIKHKVLSL